MEKTIINHLLKVLCKSVLVFGHQNSSSCRKMKELVKKGTFGFGVFECKDIFATYEELKAKGIEFTKEPKKEFYGVEALFKDDSGNWFYLGQKQ